MTDFVDGMFADDEPLGDAVAQAEADPAEFSVDNAALKPVENEAQAPIDQPVSNDRQPNAGYVPLPTLLDERQKRQNAERRAQELENFLVQQNQQQAYIPDPEQDPIGFLQMELDTVRAEKQASDAAQRNQVIMMSARFAEIQHGKELTEKAFQWAHAKCDVDPYFNQQIAASNDPLSLAIAAMQREEISSQIKPDEFQQFLAWKATQSGAQPLVSPVATLPQPKSLGFTPIGQLASAGGVRPPQQAQVVDDNAMMDQLFQ